jgi:hypothetical protein
MFDNWESIVALVVAVLIAYAVVLWLGTIVWTYRDIRERTADGWSQTVSLALVALFNIPGLVLYLILRPHETLTEAYERRLEAEALMRDMPDPRPTCPTCKRNLSAGFLLCPYCRTKLREPCSACARPLELNWVVCPYCAAPGPQAASAPPPAPAATTQPRLATSAPMQQPLRQPTQRTTPSAAAPTPPARSEGAPPPSGQASLSESIWRRLVG